MPPMRTLSGTSGNVSCGKCASNSALSSCRSGRECSCTNASRRKSFMQSTSPACVQNESCTPANAKPVPEHPRRSVTVQTSSRVYAIQRVRLQT